MRLSEIRQIIKENMDSLSSSVQNRSPDGKFAEINDVLATMNAVENLGEIPSFEELTWRIQGISEAASVKSNEKALIPFRAADNFCSLVAKLKNECRIVLSLADSILPQTEENLICIRLSKDIRDIADLKKLVDLLEKAFQLTSGIKNYPGRASFAGVESGTNWLNLVIDTAEYAGLLYLIIQTAYEAVRDFYTLEGLKKKHEAIDALRNVTDSSSSLVSELNKSILSKKRVDGSLDVSHEEFTSLCKASQIFSQIVMDGSKILLSIEAPKEKQDTILSVAQQVDSAIGEAKQLEARTKADDNSGSPDGDG